MWYDFHEIVYTVFLKIDVFSRLFLERMWYIGGCTVVVQIAEEENFCKTKSESMRFR